MKNTNVVFFFLLTGPGDPALIVKRKSNEAKINKCPHAPTLMSSPGVALRARTLNCLV